MSTTITESEVRRSFADPDHQRHFEQEGYVTMPLLDAEEVTTLRSDFLRRHPEPEQGFHTDLERTEEHERQEIEAMLEPVWDRHLNRFLDDHRVFMSSFLVKWPGPESELYVHQDLTFVDEDRFRSLAFWIALDDASEEIGNGALQILPRSHLMADEYRGTNTGPWYADQIDEVRAAMVSLPVKAGDLVVMDNRLIHGSPANRTDRPRVAVAGAAVPAEADLIHAVAAGEGIVGLHRVDDEYYRRNSPLALMADPPTGPFYAIVPQQRRAPRRDLLPATMAADSLPDRISTPEDLDSLAPDSGEDAPLLARVLGWNHRRVANEYADRPGPVYGSNVAPWLPALEDDWSTIRQEWDEVTARGVQPLPMDLVTGGGLQAEGSWDALPLRHNGGWVDHNRERFPRTTAAIEGIPGLRAALFSVLGPDSVLPLHRGQNNGVLRAHLGLVVPGELGDTWLDVGQARLFWEEGRAIVFDDSYTHGAANTTSEPRVVLMLEFDRPLEGRPRTANRLVQQAFVLHPQVRGAEARLAEVDAAANPEHLISA